VDNKYNQLVTTYKTVQYRSINFIVVMGIILAIWMLLFGQVVPAVILIIAAAASFYFKRYLYVEYEYKFDSGNVEIYKIIGKSMRKKLIEFNIKDIEILSPESSKSLKALANIPHKKKNLYPVTSKEKIYAAILKLNDERIKLRFVPDEKFVELCFRYNRNVVKKS
jgi:hypothetical protein